MGSEKSSEAQHEPQYSLMQVYTSSEKPRRLACLPELLMDEARGPPSSLEAIMQNCIEKFEGPWMSVYITYKQPPWL